VIVRNENRNEVKPMRWGLVPSWAQDPSIGQRMINARAETLLEKTSFKQLVPTRRCLVPAGRVKQAGCKLHFQVS
jgi:putative SOS response-associated peptidase YedK